MTISASTAGALKAYIESKGLGLAVYKDVPPPDELGKTIFPPYVTVSEGIAVTPVSDEDGGAGNGGESYVVELAQVDLWMAWRDQGNGRKESPALARSLHRILAGAMLDTSPARVYNVAVQNDLRLEERDNNLVHHAITLAINRVA